MDAIGVFFAGLLIMVPIVAVVFLFRRTGSDEREVRHAATLAALAAMAVGVVKLLRYSGISVRDDIHWSLVTAFTLLMWYMLLRLWRAQRRPRQ